MAREKQGKVFYGWLIVAGCFGLMAVTYGAINNCMGVFIKPVCQDMGFSRAGMGVTQTIMAASLMLMSLVSGRIFARVPVVRVLRLSSVVMAAGYFCFSLARSLPMFYGAALVTGLAEGAITTVALSLLISNWFHSHRGLAVGLAFMGSGVGGMVCNPLASWLIGGFGWQTAYRVLAAGVFAIAAPVCFFLLRDKPEDKGLRPYGEQDEQIDYSQIQRQGTLFYQAARQPRFWALCLCAALNTICTSGLMQNTAPHISDVGFSPAFAATIASCGMASLAVGKLLLGWLYDKLGAAWATTISQLSAIIGLAGALLAPALPGVGLIVLGVGLGGAFGNVAHPIIAQIVYGDRDFSSIFGVISASANVGGMLTPVLVGGSYDMLGSYKPAFTCMIGLLVLVTFTYLWAFRGTERQAGK